MNLTADGAWIADVRRVLSPNCDDRPAEGTISLIVVHSISLPPGQYGGDNIDALFTNRLDPLAHPYFADIAHLQVSSHVLIRRAGELVQYVPFNRRAWHAGCSCYREREACNDFAIGIELEGHDHEPYAPIQYRQLAALVRELRGHYPGIAAEAIVGHSEISPGRKTDPGPAFDWDHLRSLLA